MRRNLVLESYDAIRAGTFEDVVHIPVGGAPVAVPHAISGVVPNSERFEVMGEKLRTASHLTHAARAAFPDLRRGDLIDDGQDVWKVIDFEPWGDGRVELMVALVKA